MNDVTIELVSNGAVLTDSEGDKEVFKFQQGDLEGLQELLWTVQQIVQPADGKYNSQRIQINIVHGSGYVCKDKKCPICKEKI